MVEDLEGASTKAMMYGLLAVTLVSLASLAGGIVLPLVSGKSRRLWMHFFIAMAVGTLSSDAVLHLIPQVLGLHSHSHEHHDHGDSSTFAPAALVASEGVPISTVSPPGTVIESHEDDDHDHDHNGNHTHGGYAHHPRGHSHQEEHEHSEHSHEHGHSHSHDEGALSTERLTLLKLSCLLLAVYILYLIEFVAYFRSDGTGGHSHSPAGDAVSPAVTPPFDMKTVGWDAESASASPSATAINIVSPLLAAPPVFCGLRGPALIILFGDGVHNFIDGVAMGASFATSTSVGIATTIAVLCHELPHELGDMAVLLETGLSMAKALILNLISALTAYIGFFVGLYAVSIESAQSWLLAVTAGMFLYVAWIDMLSHLKHEAAEKLDPWYIIFCLQFAGLVFGTLLMFILGWYEHEWFH